MPIDPSVVTPEIAWSGSGPDPDSTLEVRLQPAGLWHVMYGGLSWATSDLLRVALGEACGVPRNEPWTIETEQQILTQIAG